VLTRLRTCTAAVFGAAAFAAAPAEASDVWVARNGSDAAPGTTTRPLKTIDRGLELAEPGDRVLVRAGTYPEMVEAGPRGTQAAPITLQPAAGERPIVSGGFKLIDARWVQVKDMTFDGTGNPDGWGTSIWSSQHVELAGNEITGYQEAQGILIKDRSAHVRLTANRIHHLGIRHRFEHGIYCESARQVVIAENVIHDIPHGYGIHLFGDCDGARIVRNTIARNGLSGIIIAGNDERGTADNTLIARNVIAYHRVPAYSEYGFAVTEYQPGRGNVVRNNVFFGNVADEDMDCEACAARGNVERDPGFVNAAGGDFRLLADGAARARRSGAR
jgi:Right handed beta helix region